MYGSNNCGNRSFFALSINVHKQPHVQEPGGRDDHGGRDQQKYNLPIEGLKLHNTKFEMCFLILET
jgi:hypothetical protein